MFFILYNSLNISKPPENHLFQSTTMKPKHPCSVFNLCSETSNHLPPIFVPKGGRGGTHPNEDDGSIKPIVDDDHTHPPMMIVMVFVIRKIIIPNRSKVMDHSNSPFIIHCIFHYMTGYEPKCLLRVKLAMGLCPNRFCECSRTTYRFRGSVDDDCTCRLMNQCKDC